MAKNDEYEIIIDAWDFGKVKISKEVNCALLRIAYDHTPMYMVKAIIRTGPRGSPMGESPAFVDPISGERILIPGETSASSPLSIELVSVLNPKADEILKAAADQGCDWAVREQLRVAKLLPVKPYSYKEWDRDQNKTPFS